MPSPTSLAAAIPLRGPRVVVAVHRLEAVRFLDLLVMMVIEGLGDPQSHPLAVERAREVR